MASGIHYLHCNNTECFDRRWCRDICFSFCLHIRCVKHWKPNIAYHNPECLFTINNSNWDRFRYFSVTWFDDFFIVQHFLLSGSYLFKHVFNRSYSIMFSINCTLMMVSILYSAFRLKVFIDNKRSNRAAWLNKEYFSTTLCANFTFFLTFQQNSGEQLQNKTQFGKWGAVGSLATFSTDSMSSTL